MALVLLQIIILYLISGHTLWSLNAVYLIATDMGDIEIQWDDLIENGDRPALFVTWLFTLGMWPKYAMQILRSVMSG